MKTQLTALCLFLVAVTTESIASERIESSRDALRYVLESSGMEFSENVRVASLYERNKSGLSWRIKLRDGDWTYQVKVTDERAFEMLGKEESCELNNLEFWEAQPKPLELPLASSYVKEAKGILERFNPRFTVNAKTYQSILSVCNPVKVGRKSRRNNGCASVYLSNKQWDVRMKVDLPDQSWRVLDVVFDGQEALQIRQQHVHGRWQF